MWFSPGWMMGTAFFSTWPFPANRTALSVRLWPVQAQVGASTLPRGAMGWWPKLYCHFSGLTGKKAFVLTVVLTERLGKENLELFQACVGRQNKLSAALKSHQTSPNSCGTARALPRLWIQGRVQMGATFAALNPQFYLQCSHRERAALIFPFLPEWDPHRVHPFRQKDRSCRGWAASVRQICILINLGTSNSLPSLFFFCIYTSGADVGKLRYHNECVFYNSQVTLNTHSTNKSLRKVFIGLNIETKFYFLKMTLHTSCKCTFR